MGTARSTTSLLYGTESRLADENITCATLSLSRDDFRRLLAYHLDVMDADRVIDTVRTQARILGDSH